MEKRARTNKVISGKAPPDGPFLAAAMLCESVINEVDGPQSIFRIIDTVNVESEDGEFPEGALQATVVAIFKAGDSNETLEALLTLVSPNGEERNLAKGPMVFEATVKGPQSGVSLASQMLIRINSPGLHWIELRLGGTLYTKIPLYVHQVTSNQAK